MTEFVKREREELEKFRHRVSQYGLEVYNSISGHYVGAGTDVFVINMMTKPQPSKGKKELIEQLKRDGFHVNVYRRTDWNTNRAYMAFYVVGIARISTNEKGEHNGY